VVQLFNLKVVLVEHASHLTLQLMLEVSECFFVLLEHSVEVDERLHRGLVGGVLGRILNFNIKGYWHEVESVLLSYFAMFLHDLEQVELLRKQLVELHVVHQLFMAVLTDNGRGSNVLCR
jgi:hypothetical protein